MLVFQQEYKDALTIYRKIDSALSGSGELMKIQFVRDKIENLLNMIMAEPDNPQAAEVIREEKKSAEDRFKITVLEANYYLDHELYNESLFLFKKLEKEWRNSKDKAKLVLVRKKIQTLSELVDDPDKIPFQERDSGQVLYIKQDGSMSEDSPEDIEPPPDTSTAPRDLLMYHKMFKEKDRKKKKPADDKPLKKVTESTEPNIPIDPASPFGNAITDAEYLVSKKQYREALSLYRRMNSSLVGSGDLMKIQFVRDKIESLLSRIKNEPLTPETEEVLKEENMSAEERYEATLAEAENYYAHELYREALYLYRKLEKEWGRSGDPEKTNLIRQKIQALGELVEDPFRIPSQPAPVSQVIYLDDDGSLNETFLETEEKGPGFSRAARALTIALLKQRALLNIIYILIFAAGIYSIFTIPVENMPSVDLGEVYITTYYYGASAEDVENLVTIPIEKSIEGLENIKSIKSRSYRNCSSVGVKFVDDADYKDLFSRLRIQVLNNKEKLPDGVEDPKFLFVDTHWWISVIRVNLYGEASEKNRRFLAEKLKTELQGINGIRDIEITGEAKNEFHVSLSPEKLRKQGMTFSEVAEALKSAGTKVPTGNFSTDKSEFVLDAGTNFTRQEDVLNVIIRKDGFGNFVRVSDVVTSAMISHPDPMNIASINGEDTISLIVRKENDANAIKIAKQVKSIGNAFLKKHSGDGINIIYTNDSTQEINDSVNILNGNLILGIILVTITLWMTIGFRNAIFAALGIPFSFLCTLIILKQFGISINSINLFAFILVSGIIVDDAIVIIENIYRHQQMGKPLRVSVIDGVAEIFWPVTSSMLTTVVAFLPMLLITGPIGSFFAMIPIAVTLALCASLFEAMVFLPAHIFEWGPKFIPKSEDEEESDPETKKTNTFFDKVWILFEGLLNVFLNNRWKALTMVVLLFFVSIAISGLSLTGVVPLIKVKFFPGNYVRYHVTVALPSSTPIRKTDSVVRDIAKFILSLGEKQALSVSGTAGYFEDQDYNVLGGGQYGQAVVALPERSVAKFPENPTNDPVKHIDYIREKLKLYMAQKFPDPDERPQINVFPENNGPVSGKAINVRVSGENLDQELEVSTKIQEYLKSTPETKDLVEVKDDRAVKINVVKYTPMEDMAYELGISPGSITQILAGSLNGIPVGKFHSSTEEIDLKVRLARILDPGGPFETGLEAPQDVLDIPIIEHSSSPVFLRDVVNVSYLSEPDSRGRVNGKSTVIITGDIPSGSNLSPEHVKLLTSKYFESISKDYPEVTLSFGGESEDASKTFHSLFVGLVVALILIYLILAVEFGDYVQPVIILSAVGFAIIGVTFGMLLTRSTFTVGSLMAVVGLAGVTVNNSLILIDFTNIRINEGMTMRQAVKDACRARIRPVLLTTVTTIMGLLPMAIGIPFRSLEWSPMATTFVTGLGCSTLLTLLLIPVEYELVALMKTKIMEKFN